MQFTLFKNIVFITIFSAFSCGNAGQKLELSIGEPEVESLKTKADNELITDAPQTADTSKRFGRKIDSKSTTHIYTGANQWQQYMPLLKGKKVGIVANQTSVVNDTLEYPDEIRIVDFHLVDFIVDFENHVTKVFAPEHGFRGKADAGELVKDGIDTKTGVPIISLYGKNKKPSAAQLEDIEVMVFDIQDVGARFYTYISTLHYVMEACAELGIPVILLDRPNPNGHYIDGPILEPEHKSFVGMHPVPVVHGMTIGEYAQMINGQGWLNNKIKCELTVIPMQNYTHDTPYLLPIKPSPNLPNDIAINLYPSLCFFEGTLVSAGRGTENQFQVFGAPSLPTEFYPYTFTPQANEGAKHPKFKGERCNGLDLTRTPKNNRLNLEWLIEAYVANGRRPDFFNKFFTKLAGTERLKWQIENRYTYSEIRKEWIRPLAEYDSMRQAYLIYK